MTNSFIMNTRDLILYSFVFLGFSIHLHSQVQDFGVGINTTSPRKTLEVAGNANIDGEVRVNVIDEFTQDEEVTFLIQNQTNFVKEIDASGDGLAVAYFQEYILTNMQNGVGDWIQDLDTSIPSSEYVITIISAYYNQELTMEAADASNFAIPYISAFVKDGTWHISADYPSAKNRNTTEPGKWVINTLILSRAFSKILPTQTFDLSNTSSGAATTPVID